MKAIPQTVAKLCSLVALLYSLVVIISITYINKKVNPIFIFFSIQAYLNWYSVINISRRATITVVSNAEYKCWYCEKCLNYACKPTQHCIYCRKCFHFRDHHCFFLGACILRQNIGNFILFCFYTSLTCIYSLCTVGPYLYENINRVIKTDTDSYNIFLNFCFPVALIKLLQSRENTFILLVTMFDALVSILCISLVYATWKLHSCITGKQRYANVSGKQSLREIFGSYGLLNIIFPYNGLMGTRNNGKYELKQV